MSIPFRQLTSAAGCHRENECSLWKGWQLYRRGLMKRVSSTRDLWLSFWTTWRYRTQVFMFRSHRGATRKNGCAFQNLFEGKQKELTRGCCCIYVWESCFREFFTGFKHFSALRGKGNMHHIVLECMTWFFFFNKREHNCCMLQQLCSAAANLLLVSLHKFQMHSHLSCPSPVAFEHYCKHLFVSCSLFQGK